MKAKTRKKTKTTGSRVTSTRSRKSGRPGKSIEDRDLNEDEQDQITNIDKDEDLTSAPENNSRTTGFTVEEEEEREKRRKVEDIRPDEPMK